MLGQVVVGMGKVGGKGRNFEGQGWKESRCVCWVGVGVSGRDTLLRGLESREVYMDVRQYGKFRKAVRVCALGQGVWSVQGQGKGGRLTDVQQTTSGRWCVCVEGGCGGLSSHCMDVQ